MKIEIQYTEYEPDTWTVPVHTQHIKLESLLNDASVERVRLTFEDGTQRVFEQC